MGKLRQKKKAPKRRTNPIQRTLEQRAKEGTISIPAPKPEQVTPVVEKVKKVFLFFVDLCILIRCLVIFRRSNRKSLGSSLCFYFYIIWRTYS